MAPNSSSIINYKYYKIFNNIKYQNISGILKINIILNIFVFIIFILFNIYFENQYSIRLRNNNIIIKLYNL